MNLRSQSRTVPLRALAHSRSGDKGGTVNVAVIAYEVEAFPCIADQLSVDAFAVCYEGLFDGPVTRYEVPRLGVLNFVCEGALGGGVSRNLCLDNYGKALASRVLDFAIELPETTLALREPVGDPLLPYLRAAGLDPSDLQDSPWIRALFPRCEDDVRPPGAMTCRRDPNEEAGTATTFDEAHNWRKVP